MGCHLANSSFPLQDVPHSQARFCLVAFGLKGYLEHLGAAAELDTRTHMRGINLLKSSPRKHVLVLEGLWGQPAWWLLRKRASASMAGPSLVLQELGHSSGQRRCSQRQVQHGSFIFQQLAPQPGSLLFIPHSTATSRHRKAWWKSKGSEFTLGKK